MNRVRAVYCVVKISNELASVRQLVQAFRVLLHAAAGVGAMDRLQRALSDVGCRLRNMGAKLTCYKLCRKPVPPSGSQPIPWSDLPYLEEGLKSCI